MFVQVISPLAVIDGILLTNRLIPRILNVHGNSITGESRFEYHGFVRK